MIQFIGKPDPKIIHHNYKPLQLHLQVKQIRLGHRRCRTLVSWIGTSKRPHHCPGRIGTSTQTSTLPDWIGTSKSARSDLDVDTSLNRQTPLGWIGLGHRHELSYRGQRLQPSSTTNSTRSSQEPLATPLWRHCCPYFITASQATMTSPAIIEANCHKPRHNGVADAPLQLAGMGRHHNNAFMKIGRHTPTPELCSTS